MYVGDLRKVFDPPEQSAHFISLTHTVGTTASNSCALLEPAVKDPCHTSVDMPGYNRDREMRSSDYSNGYSARPVRDVLEERSLELKNRQMEVEIESTKQRIHNEHADIVRKSMSNQYPVGKDCSRDMCHPYTATIKEVLWGFSTQEPINESTTEVYRQASTRALQNLRTDLFDNSNRMPVVPNLISGLPVPFTFRANNQTLSRDNRPYWFWPYTQDPNPGVNKHGRVTWECKDLTGNVVATLSTSFAEYNDVAVSCNEIASKYASEVQRRKNK